MSLAETNLFKTGVAAQRPCGGAAVHDYPGATAWKRSGHRGTTQDDPHSNVTYPIGRRRPDDYSRELCRDRQNSPNCYTRPPCVIFPRGYLKDYRRPSRRWDTYVFSPVGV